MNIINNYTSSINQSGYSLLAKSKGLSKNRWELSEDLAKSIIELARKDAAENVYMGNEYRALVDAEIAKVAPDREALKAKATAAIKSGNIGKMPKDELYDRWVILLFGTPYGVEGDSMGLGDAIHIYDENGDEILTYSGGVGWHMKPTQSETKIWQTTTKIYYEAYRNERNIIKNNLETNDEFQYMEAENSFEVKA